MNKQTERAVYTMYEVANLLGINLPKAYELAKAKDFPAIRLGRRIIVPKVAFEKWLLEKALDKESNGAL
ncbi:MAG TPA: excisionase [Thermoanaerobacter sp.]|nr:excisionase [Thermoanaerobacter sp.]